MQADSSTASLNILVAAMDYFEALMIAPDAEILARPAWHRRAACRGMGTDLFFLDKGQSVAPALDVCRTCPVTAECLGAGLSTAHGVWGATTPRARQMMRVDRQAA